jgi:putative oxidoreductase
MRALFQTDDSIAPVLLRIALAVVIFPHGAQKLLGWFGGFGFSGTMGSFTGTLGIPWILGLLAIVAEFFGPVALVLGFLTRVAAFGIGCNMVGAVLLVHAPNGFFMNWSGQQQGEGFEFHLLALGIAVALILTGGGRASVDASVARA